MNRSDLDRNACLPDGKLGEKGYMRWWHSFMGVQPRTGERKCFYIEYGILNPDAREKNLSCCMITAGVLGGKDASLHLQAVFPVSSLRIALHPLVIEIEDNFFSEQHICGSANISPAAAERSPLPTDTGSLSWDLEIHKAIACHTGSLSQPGRHAHKHPDTCWHAEGIQTFYRGIVILNGVTYLVTRKDCFGYADKHWGSAFTNPWLQLSCCHIARQSGRELKHSALAAESCRPRKLGFPCPDKLLVQLTCEGEDYDFLIPDSLTKWRCRKKSGRLLWQVVAENTSTILKFSASVPGRELTKLYRQAPDGQLHAFLASGSGTGTLHLYRKTDEGKEAVDTLILSDVLCIASVR